jgi:hypothetical protein
MLVRFSGSKPVMWTLVAIAAVVLIGFGIFAWRDVRESMLADEERLRR